MGRLGFNLVREKDVAAKNVESGLPQPDAQQNESNEGAEIGELILACERNRRTIRSLRLLSFCLAVMLMCMGAYVILTETKYYNDQPKQELKEEVEPEAKNDALIATSATVLYEDAFANSYDRSNCTREMEEMAATRSDLERKLEAERRDHERFARECDSRFDELRHLYNELTGKHELLAKQEKEESATLEQLRQERAELIQKLEASQQKLQRSAGRRAAAARAASTSTTTSTTTPAPQKANIFDTEQFRKINDLVKDIETVGRLFGSVFDEII